MPAAPLRPLLVVVVAAAAACGPRLPVLTALDERTIAMDLEVLWETFLLYDMGGQSVYPPCQAPFLTPGALFVVVLDLSRGLEYCTKSMVGQLKTLMSRVPDAIAMVVGTKADAVPEEVGGQLGKLEDARQAWLAKVHDAVRALPPPPPPGSDDKGADDDDASSRWPRGAFPPLGCGAHFRRECQDRW